MRRFIVILFFLASAVQLYAMEVSTYTVVKGDTLWDISGKVYDNPWHWPKIFDANKSQIADPNIIYPDQQFSIPDKSLPCPPPPEGFNEDMTPESTPVQKTEILEEPKTPEQVSQDSEASGAPVGTDGNAAEEQVPEVQTTVEPVSAFAETASIEAAEEPAAEEEIIPESPAIVKKTTKKKLLNARSYIVPEKWVADGVITGDAEKNLMISAGDTVFVNLGQDKVKPGTQCDVIRRLGRVKDPVERKYLGYEMRRVGIIEITQQVGENMSSAKVITSNDPIAVGDMLKIIEAE